ncbi:MAG: FG-GAP-like repeat-containing protein, partial [Acetobacteraceae bacterium]|nr:FG-GAP-like repeat-containing protein [Acetobacteraceae bacterium]
SVTFAENTVNATPQLIDSNVVFTAGDSLAGGRLVVAGLLAEDRVSILTEGSGAGQIGVSGSAISYGGVAIGTASGGQGSAFTVTFNSAVTGEAVDALIQRLAYANLSDTPTTTRTLTLDVVDASGVRVNAPLAPAFTALTDSANPFNGIDVGFRSAPSFVDLDNDGLLDLVSGEFFGTLRVWRNTGSATAPAFTALTGSANPFNGIDVGWISAPSFVDLDGNGRLDLVSGEEYGTLLAWRNTGSATAPAFTALTGSANPFNRIDVGRFSTPSFVDLDSDGRLDLVSGENFGTLRAWRNTTPLPSITVSVTAENDAPTGAVNIVNHGDTLRATNTLNDAEGVGVVSYAWQSSTDAGATWQAIPGASSADLALGASLSGMVVRVVASYVDGRGTPEAVASGGARIGTASADVLTAGAGISILLGFGGNDSLTGAAGSDLLDAGDGADTLVGGSGASQRVHGSGGGDSVLGGSGLGQWLYGGAGHDTMQAGSGNGQELWGAWDNDSIMGGEAFAAYMNGESGDDTLVGGNGASQALLGDIGEDSLVGGSGNGQGLDAGDGADTLVGGSGASQRVHGSGGGDSVLGGSGLGQWLYGGAGHDTMLAGSGNGQELWGAWDNDSIMGGEAFAAYMNGESGDDTLVGGNGASQALLGDIGEDSLVGGSGNGQGLIGGDGNDTLRAGSGTGQVLFGGTGQDSLAGSSSADSLLGEDGNDTLAGGLGADTMDGGAGSDDWVSYAGATEAIGAAIVPSLQPGHWG